MWSELLQPGRKYVGLIPGENNHQSSSSSAATWRPGVNEEQREAEAPPPLCALVHFLIIYAEAVVRAGVVGVVGGVMGSVTEPVSHYSNPTGC